MFCNAAHSHSHWHWHIQQAQTRYSRWSTRTLAYTIHIHWHIQYIYDTVDGAHWHWHIQQVQTRYSWWSTLTLAYTIHIRYSWWSTLTLAHTASANTIHLDGASKYSIDSSSSAHTHTPRQHQLTALTAAAQHARTHHCSCTYFGTATVAVLVFSTAANTHLNDPLSLLRHIQYVHPRRALACAHTTKNKAFFSETSLNYKCAWLLLLRHIQDVHPRRALACAHTTNNKAFFSETSLNYKCAWLLLLKHIQDVDPRRALACARTTK
jgi:hypothetical protein